MAPTIDDLKIDGVSNCCSAAVYMLDVCSECKEHCEIVDEDDDNPGILPPDRI